MTTERNHTADSPSEDPNYTAFQKLLTEGAFSQIDPKTWLAFRNGQLIAQAESMKEIIEKTKGSEDGETLITQVQQEPIDLPGFFVDPEGNLRRGVAVIGIDENGKESPVNLEWGTMNVYPVNETPEE